MDKHKVESSESFHPTFLKDVSSSSMGSVGVSIENMSPICLFNEDSDSNGVQDKLRLNVLEQPDNDILLDENNNTKDTNDEIFQPFFLNEIDISSEILQAEPNEEVLLDSVEIGEKERIATLVDKTELDPFDTGSITALDKIEVTLKKKSTIIKVEDTKVGTSYTDNVCIGYESNKDYDDESSTKNLNNSVKSRGSKRDPSGSSTVTITNIEKYGGSFCSMSSRDSSAANGDHASNIRVVVRVRPLSDSENQHGDKSCVTYPGDDSIEVDGVNQRKSFTFNCVLPEHSSQEEVFQESGIRNLIDKALDGFSCTVFAFGPTGSGKTHTIIGSSEQSIGDMLDNQDLCGIIGRSFRYLFESADKRSSLQYTIKASFLEIYNEKVKDLLNPSHSYDSLPVRWSARNGFHVENLFSVECEDSQDLMSLLVEGSNYRQVGVHAINEHSSRSHAIFTVYLESEEMDADDVEDVFPVIRHGKISFIDLAGSERAKETKATGDLMAESNNINKSLLVLGNCISALGDRKKRGYHIPYRDSKLTKLLADSLGGEGFTLMIPCISPSSKTCQDTINALRYANRAKNIKNKPVVKMDPKEQLFQRLKREIRMLRTENNYFREQQGVPSSDTQIVIIPNEIGGELTPNSGVLSPAIGSGSLSSLHSNRINSSKEPDNVTPTKNTLHASLGTDNGVYDMLQEYMKENENLKAENMELHSSRAVAHREHEEMVRENDKLTKKLSELGRVMLNSPTSRENVQQWINEGLGSELLQKRRNAIISQDGKIKLPAVRPGSYPNVVAADSNTFLNDIQVNNREKNQIDKMRTPEKKLNIDVNRSAPNRNINSSSPTSEKGVLTKNDNQEEEEEEVKIDSIVADDGPKTLTKKNSTTKSKKTKTPKARRVKKKPTAITVEKPCKPCKPCSYAAQFDAARKGLRPKPKHQKTLKTHINQPNLNAPYSTIPAPYQTNANPPYMNYPIYNYHPGYIYSYVGMARPPQHATGGISSAAYEHMANRLQKDLDSLNGQLRTDVAFQQSEAKHLR